MSSSFIAPAIAGNALQANLSLRHHLFGVLRRWHARRTHQRFALDSLPLVQTESGHRLVSVLLHHFDRYLAGTIDPDVRFRDFQNHMIHVGQGYWGGAPRLAHRWYDRLLADLRDDRDGDAAHAAGVLSHYFTDPLQPLHTMQCPRGRVIHRPLEWSVMHSYDEIARLWIEDDMHVVVQLSDGPGWLGEAILHGARYANRQYDQLVNEFDLDAAVKCPQRGLNGRARSSLAKLFGLAITGWARILDRAAVDAERLRNGPIPVRRLVPSYLTAAMQIPMQKWRGRLESRIEGKEIIQLVREYRRLGELRRYLPAEVDIMDRVAQVYADEQRYRRRQEELGRLRDSEGRNTRPLRIYRGPSSGPPQNRRVA